MINKELQAWGRQLANKIVAPLAASHVTPNMLTVIGLLLNLLTGLIIATGHIGFGGAMMLFAGVFDMFDGALARVTGKASTFGAFFDSTLDRIAEAAVGLGLLIYYGNHHDMLGSTLLYLVIIGSLMVSYARARAEGLNLECKVGMMARPERVIALSIGLLLGPTVTLGVLIVLAVTTWYTVMQRIYHVYRQTELSSHADEPGQEGQARPPLFKLKRKGVA